MSSDISRATRIREEKYAITEEMRAIINTADSARRDLTPDELTRVQQLEARDHGLDAELRSAEQRIGLPPKLRAGDEASLTGGGEVRGYLTATTPPLFGREVRDLLRSPNTSGGYTVPSGVSSTVWDNLRSESVVLESGLPVIVTDKAQQMVPAVTGDAQVSWTGEAQAITETDIEFGGALAIPRKLAAYLEVSRELVDDAAPDILALVEANLAKSIALEIDRVVLEGIGANEEPTGLVATDGVGADVLGTTDGAAITVQDVKDALDAVLVADGRPSSIFMHHKTFADLSDIKTGVSGDNRYLLQNQLESPTSGFAPSLFGVPAYTTSVIDAARTVGSTQDATNLYIADNRHWALVRRSELLVEVSRDFKFQSDMVAIKATTRLDLAVMQPRAMYVLSGINLA